MRKVSGFIVILVVHAFSFKAVSQDVSFSQYTAMPVYLNPAMTGFHDGIVRVGAIYRNQWLTVGNSFQTYGGFLDASLLKSKLKNDYLGVGLSSFHDVNGLNVFRTTDIQASFAYSKGFGRNVKHSIAIGFSGQMQLKSLNLRSAVFSDGVAENFQPSNFLFDLNVGLLYHVKVTNKMNGYVGFSYQHLLQPSERWTSNSTLKWYSKYVAHAGFEVRLNDQWNIVPTALFSLQKSHIQFMLGSLGQRKIELSKGGDLLLGFGLGTRFNPKSVESIIPQLRIDVTNLFFGFSFDANLIPISRATKSVGAIELAVGYVIQNKHINQNQNTSCPKF
jgi:type IX secretion system PorP/SprF family membrane protein